MHAPNGCLKNKGWKSSVFLQMLWNFHSFFLFPDKTEFKIFSLLLIFLSYLLHCSNNKEITKHLNSSLAWYFASPFPQYANAESFKSLKLFIYLKKKKKILYLSFCCNYKWANQPNSLPLLPKNKKFNIFILFFFSTNFVTR